MVVCGGLRWFAVVCGGLWWIAVVCLLVIPIGRACYAGDNWGSAYIRSLISSNSCARFHTNVLHDHRQML